MQYLVFALVLNYAVAVSILMLFVSMTMGLYVYNIHGAFPFLPLNDQVRGNLRSDNLVIWG